MRTPAQLQAITNARHKLLVIVQTLRYLEQDLESAGVLSEYNHTRLVDAAGLLSVMVDQFESLMAPPVE